MTHENNNIGGGAEHPGSDEQKISQLLGGLKRVEAPKDFDFHVKARIAKARPSDYQRTSFFPILKYAMPLALFLTVGAGVMLVNWYEADVDNAIVSQPEIPASAAPASAVTGTPSEPQLSNSIAPEEPKLATLERQEPERRSQPSAAPRSPSGRVVPAGASRDFTPSDKSALKALEAAPTPRTPAGMSLNPKRLDEAFKLIDAEAEFAGGSWIVRSVKVNGIADQMGLRAGDKVKTIDGRSVGERTEFPPSFSARTIEVQRGKDTVELGPKMPQ